MGPWHQCIEPRVDCLMDTFGFGKLLQDKLGWVLIFAEVEGP